MYSDKYFSGVWEVMTCTRPNSQLDRNEKLGIEGTLFRLDDSGDVTWTPSKESQDVPLLSCETYEIYSPSFGEVWIRFGAYAGHVIDFRVDKPESADSETISLSCDGWCSLSCQRREDKNCEPLLDCPFSLLPALEEGFFSDLTIIASSGRQFAVHTCILKLVTPELNWKQDVPPFSGLAEDVLETILHFIYAECLPKKLSKETAQKVISTVSTLGSPYLSALAHMCELYIKNMELKLRIIGLVSDMHICGARIIEHFKGPKNTVGVRSTDGLKSDPAKLCYAVKQSIQEIAVAFAKLCELCVLFTKHKEDLSYEERLEIILYAKSRLPVFMNQLQCFLQAVNSTEIDALKLALYLVPEIENILDTVSALAVEIKVALEQIIPSATPSATPEVNSTKVVMGNILAKSLNTILLGQNLGKLKRCHQWITFDLSWLLQRKENFNKMTYPNKVRSIARNLEEVLEELPILVVRFRLIDGLLDWREFKFCFRVGTSKIADHVGFLLSHKNTLQNVLIQLCELVQRDDFTKSLINIGILDPSNYSPNTHVSDQSKPSQPTPTHSTLKNRWHKLNLVEVLCVPPSAWKSQLAKAVLPLLTTAKEGDMIFKIVNTKESDPAAEYSPASILFSVKSKETDMSTIDAHRVIVAARCDWFRRALQSGMRESIDRKIVIYDTCPLLFSIFLEYLYCGNVSVRQLSADQVADLMTISDRYEVDALKNYCEHAIATFIDSESVLYFLGLADQFNAKVLKHACIAFVSKNPEVVDSELLEELPENLQAEIFDLIVWMKPSKSGTSERSFSLSQFPSDDTLRSSRVGYIEKMVSSIELSDDVVPQNERTDDEVSQTQESTRLENCIQYLGDIVGQSVSRRELIQLALAADYDVNRAANFFYERKKIH